VVMSVSRQRLLKHFLADKKAFRRAAFSVRYLSYQKKVGEYFFPELLL
jgi:hypothetical protein